MHPDEEIDIWDQPRIGIQFAQRMHSLREKQVDNFIIPREGLIERAGEETLVLELLTVDTGSKKSHVFMKYNNLYSELNHHAKLESEKASLLQIPIRIGSPDFSSVNNLFMSCAFKTETAKHRIKK